MYYFNRNNIKKLEGMAQQLREDTIQMIHKAGSGHPGGSLSATEIVTVLYFHILNIDPEKPLWPNRDRFILSKGHCCPVYYAALARRGFFSIDALDTLRQYGSLLQGHPDMHKTPGVDISSGSLGNGLSLGVGMALSARLHKQTYRTYVLLGDGENQEGLVWEAAMAAGHYHLDDLTAIVDCNGVQINGWVNDIMRIEPLADKWKAFGWNVIECNGNEVVSLLNAFHEAQTLRGAPTVILARTVKGKGVSFMEDESLWHGKAPNTEQTLRALQDIVEGRN